MKHGKKLLALALALCMAFALAVPAFAADGDTTPPTLPKPPEANKNTPANLKDHTFELYQIFSGTYSDGLLTAINWGSGFEPTEAEKTADPSVTKHSKIAAFIAALQAENSDFGETFKGIVYDEKNSARSADAVARAIADAVASNNKGWTGIDEATWEDGNTNYGGDTLKAFADVAAPFLQTSCGSAKYPNEIVIPAGGYYLVKDATEIPGEDLDKNGQVTNLYVVQMNDKGSFKPRVKADVPELDKTVLEVNDSEAAPDTPKWDDVADYDVNDTVWFTLTGTLPTDYAEYEKYKYVFHDTLSDGLAFNANSLTVWLTERGADPNDAVQITTGFTVNDPTAEGDTITVSFNNLKALVDGNNSPIINKDSVIQVRYSATLQKGAKVQETNKAHLEFSNDPNNTGDGTGKTPEDIVTVFTFKLIVNKTSDKLQEGSTTEYEALTGADFTLYKQYVDPTQAPKDAEAVNNNYYPIKEYEDANLSTFSFEGLDAGKYMLRETEAPAGYNKIEDMYFTITAELDETADGTAYIKSLSIGDVTDASGNVLQNANGEDKKFAFAFGGNTNEQTGEKSYDGDISTSIVNMKGVVLPGTGGIGTTIFYVVGGLLIAGAGVVLITKKRMKNAE